MVLLDQSNDPLYDSTSPLRNTWQWFGIFKCLFWMSWFNAQVIDDWKRCEI